MLIIQPIGGLCNRMRAINSALVLAKKQNKKLKVIWFVNAELGCPFEELFEKTDAFTVLNIRSKWNPVKLFYYGFGKWLIYCVKKKIKSDKVIRSLYNIINRHCFLIFESNESCFKYIACLILC